MVVDLPEEEDIVDRKWVHCDFYSQGGIMIPKKVHNEIGFSCYSQFHYKTMR